MTHYRPRETGEADVINNSHQQKNKKEKKNDLGASHGESKKIEVFVSPWMCCIIQFNEGLHQNQSAMDKLPWTLLCWKFRSTVAGSCLLARIASDAIRYSDACNEWFKTAACYWSMGTNSKWAEVKNSLYSFCYCILMRTFCLHDVKSSTNAIVTLVCVWLNHKLFFDFLIWFPTIN